MADAQSPHETNNRLMVYVRVKPLPADAQDQRTIIDVVDESKLIFDPVDCDNQPEHEYYYHGKKYKQIGTRPKKNSPYIFDEVFGVNTTNLYIYETVTKPMVSATISGLNCTVFAYGATGSGKTHTMLGSISRPGVIYYTSRELYTQILRLNETDPMPADLKICYFEIYNETVRDLLKLTGAPPPRQQMPQRSDTFIKRGNKRLRTSPDKKSNERDMVGDQKPKIEPAKLNVCEGSQEGCLLIPNLSFHQPNSPEELIRLLEFGNKNRSQHPTDANADSSRSHAIFQIILTRRLVSSSQGMSIQSSKMSLIDLAGSERATVAYRAGIDRSKNLQREGGNINKSLLALGNCINALADSRKNNNHIPYRNSKLTRLLRDSLGGNCRTAMIATICQQPSHYDDTQNTLMYATRAKCIKLRPDRNLKTVTIQPRNYSTIIDNLTKRNALLMSENEDLKNEVDQLRFERQKMQSHSANLIQQANVKLTQKTLNTTHIISQPNGTSSLPSPPESPDSSSLKASKNFLDKSRYKDTLDELIDERRSIRLELLRSESLLKKNELRLVFKRLDETRTKCLNQISNKHDNNIGNNTTLITPSLRTAIDLFTKQSNGPDQDENNDNQAQGLRTQIDYYSKSVQELVDAASINDRDINETLDKMRVEFQGHPPSNSVQFDDIMDPFLSEKNNTLDLEEKKICEQHAYDLAQDAINRVMTSENVLIESADLIRYTHRILQGRGGISDALEERFSRLYKKIEGKKSVIWKDDKYDMENGKEREPFAQLLSVHDNFSLSNLTPFNSNKTLLSRRLSRNLTTLTNYTPEQSNATFDASSSPHQSLLM